MKRGYPGAKERRAAEHAIGPAGQAPIGAAQPARPPPLRLLKAGDELLAFVRWSRTAVTARDNRAHEYARF